MAIVLHKTQPVVHRAVKNLTAAPPERKPPQVVLHLRSSDSASLKQNQPLNFVSSNVKSFVQN